ncbi:LytR/AlgR family response regulator transcription factor [Paraeggerthella hongkongensis]|uniref:DNA-binding response regulator n=1 Tax=Paraeggerthella hongkongensis TaxID=230658 RepID=A0A3N0B792_9ACTN|nr:LytTR family DNA-binding domain-containing protein [Paraeggerthella hongkongensis]RNL42967.1 hypothetical protein DMP08_08265 [Paraeggerthella hongkongensis]
MILVLICEDVPQEADLLDQLVHRYAHDRDIEIGTQLYDSGERLLMNYERGEAGVVFFDIIMEGGMSGVEAARELRKKDPDVPVVFATSSAEFALDGYDVQAVHYLLKPLTYEKVADALDRCGKLLATTRRTIDITVNRERERVLVRDILYAEVFGNRAIVRLHGRTIVSYTPLAQLLEMAGESFLRCHRSYIVNMNCIERVDGREFVLATGDRIPIRANGRAAVLEAYQAFLSKEFRIGS